MATIIREFDHVNNQLTFEFSTNLDEQFSNEGYPFRNIQIYYRQCHYTCKTCSSEAYNSCLSCFTLNSSPILSQCETCKNQQNLKFLLQTQGCLKECPHGYNYDQELVCKRNIKLNNLVNLNQNQPMISQELFLSSNLGFAVRPILICNAAEQYLQLALNKIRFPLRLLINKKYQNINNILQQYNTFKMRFYIVYIQNSHLYTILNLQSSSIAIRVRVTIILIGSWNTNNYLQIKLNGQPLDSISINNLVVIVQSKIQFNFLLLFLPFKVKKKLFNKKMDLNQIQLNQKLLLFQIKVLKYSKYSIQISLHFTVYKKVNELNI